MPHTERQLVNVISAIYDAALDTTVWEPVCRKLADLLGASGFAVQINNLATREMPLYVSSGIDPAAAAAYAGEVAKADPRVLFSAGQPLGRVHHDFMFTNEREMSRSAYYNFLSHWGYRYYAGGSILRDGPLLGNASLQRTPSEGPATGHDIELLRRLLPHLGRAAQLGVCLNTLSEQRFALEQMLDQASFGAAILGARGEVLHLNREALRIISSADGLLADASGVRASRSGDNARLQRLIAGAIAVRLGAAIDGGGSMSVHKTCSGQAYVVSVSPVARMAGSMTAVQPCVFLLLVDPDAPPALSFEMLHERFGLSRSEFEIVKALVGGQTIERIARARAVTLRTVRSQLESIFRKTGTCRQVDLVSKLLPLAVSLTSGPPQRAALR